MVSAWKNSAPCLMPVGAKRSVKRTGPLRARPRKGHLLSQSVFVESRSVLWSRKRQGKRRSSRRPPTLTTLTPWLFCGSWEKCVPCRRGAAKSALNRNPTTPPPQGELSLQDFMDGKLEFALSFTDEYLEGHVVGLDQMIMNKLRAGGLSPEAHLDLHGLNAVQAFEALRGFMRGCWYKGLRTVLVVPGRGRNSPDGMGVLREKLQSWLTQDPFKRVVLAFCTAQSHDGGPGSVYVLLRKYRKKGRIYWERMPADADLY